MDLNAKEIGKRIKQFRKEKRITQKQLAEEVGCAEMTISQYERGLYSPKTNTRIAIAKALGIPYNSLFGVNDTDLASMLPEAGGYIENNPDSARTQADFERAKNEDLSQQLRPILEKSGMVTPVPDSDGIIYYLHDKNRRAIKVDCSDYNSYLRRQLANITNYHYGYVDILRSMQETPPDTNDSPDDNHD